MELIDILQQINQKSMGAAQLTDLTIGTVVKVDPLEISINPAMAPLNSSVIYLTAGVVEKKITNLSHAHTYGNSNSTSEMLRNVVCLENGKPLPVSSDYIVLNRGLEINDKVLILKVQRGQKFVVLSRVFD